MSRPLAAILNALGLCALALVLLAAFAAQIVLGELPCPLCLLQRIAFALLAVGPVLNLRRGARPSHYALSLMAALAGAAIATRQVLLHILPGDPGFGSALLGLHYYTWSLLAFLTASVLIALMLLFDRPANGDTPLPDAIRTFGALAVWLVIGLTALNALSSFLECGPAACPDNPVRYRLLDR